MNDRITADIVKTSRAVRCAYLAHPVGPYGDYTVADNLARAKRWLAWLIDCEPFVSFAAPWIPICEVLDDAVPAHRARGLRDSISMVVRFDGICLVGGKISTGMAAELVAARKLRLMVWDLTALGDEPPVVSPECGALGCAAIYAPPKMAELEPGR